ncbi:MAG: hypothetical protein WDZ40_02000 [Candidatus Spechtbacterales bacterium]
MQRPNWDEFFFALAHIYSTRGTCDRLKTACVLVDKNKRLVGAGYNGALPKNPQCDDVGHLIIEGHCVRTLHGEENAILYSTANLIGASAYIIGTPCIRCTTKLIAKGVKEIKYTGEYKNSEGKEHIFDLAERNDVKLEHADFDFVGTMEKMTDILKDKGGALHIKEVVNSNKDI